MSWRGDPVAVVRLVVGGVIAFAGACIAALALAREFLSDPLGLDWLDPSQIDQQLLGGDVNNYLLFLGGAVVFGFGGWIAGQLDEWMPG